MQFSRQKPSSFKEEEITTYIDVSLDEDIVLLKFDLEKIIIKKMGILQEALAKNKIKELVRRDHRQKQALIDIKEIFLDAFSLLTLDENKSIIT